MFIGIKMLLDEYSNVFGKRQIAFEVDDSIDYDIQFVEYGDFALIGMLYNSTELPIRACEHLADICLEELKKQMTNKMAITGSDIVLFVLEEE